MIRTLLVVAAVAAAAPAPARPDDRWRPSRRWGAFDVGAQTYTPNIDAEFSTSPGPYERTIGRGHGWLFTMGGSYAPFTRLGSLEIGLRAGWFSRSGHALVEETAGSWVAKGAESTFRMVPTSATVTYRFDLPADRWRVPLAPYGRLALDRYNWWIVNAAGDTVKKGATMGWSWAGGVVFLLDVLDPGLARDFDRDFGVNHTGLYFELTRSSVDDFGSSKSWDLSTKDLSYALGLTLVF